MGKKHEHDTVKKPLVVEENEELVRNDIVPEEPSLSEENLENESENIPDNKAESSDSLWEDAFAAAQVIEDSKKEKQGLKEKIIGAFKKHEDRTDEKKNSGSESDSNLVALKNDLEAKDNQLKRLAADFDNFRRRQSQEREDLLKYASEKLILDILPILDNFERALLSSKDAKDIASVVSGIDLIQKQLFDVMRKNGVEPIEALNNVFDPNYHEAVQQFVDDDKPDQTVINELQKGYILNGRVIRPSMVIVSTVSE